MIGFNTGLKASLGALFLCAMSVFSLATVAGQDGGNRGSTSHSRAKFSLDSADVIVFVGGDNMVRAQQSGYLESILTHQFAEAEPRFRDLAWEGDTVFFQSTVRERWREEAFGNWSKQLNRIGATLIIAQFGQLESLEGAAGLDRFTAAYGTLLDQFELHTDRIILISPTPFERSTDLLPDLSKRNADLQRYVAAARQIAQQRDYPFVDVFGRFQSGTPFQDRFTSNGIHLTKPAQKIVAAAIAKDLGVDARALNELEPLRIAVVKKHALWYNYWRPANWKCIFGDDSQRIFSKATLGLPSIQEEWESFAALIKSAEKEAWRLATTIK